MKDSKYVTDFVKTVYTESTELCMTAFDEKECLQDATILINQLRAKNARLREALEKITYPNLYIDKNQYGATWKSIARKYYEIAEKALKEGNDER